MEKYSQPLFKIGDVALVFWDTEEIWGMKTKPIWVQVVVKVAYYEDAKWHYEVFTEIRQSTFQVTESQLRSLTPPHQIDNT